MLTTDTTPDPASVVSVTDDRYIRHLRAMRGNICDCTTPQDVEAIDAVLAELQALREARSGAAAPSCPFCEGRGGPCKECGLYATGGEAARLAELRAALERLADDLESRKAHKVTYGRGHLSVESGWRGAAVGIRNILAAAPVPEPHPERLCGLQEGFRSGMREAGRILRLSAPKFDHNVLAMPEVPVLAWEIVKLALMSTADTLDETAETWQVEAGATEAGTEDGDGG